MPLERRADAKWALRNIPTVDVLIWLSPPVEIIVDRVQEQYVRRVIKSHLKNVFRPDIDLSMKELCHSLLLRLPYIAIIRAKHCG
jgi:hypothetical protein